MTLAVDKPKSSVGRRLTNKFIPLKDLAEKPKMQFSMRGYQKKCLKLLSEYLDPYSLLVQLTTGGGKTAIFSKLAVDLWNSFKEYDRGKTLVITHNTELLAQTRDNLFKNGKLIATTKIKTFLKEPDNYHALVANIQCFPHLSEERWADLASHFDLIIVDECHHYVAASFCEPILHFRDNCKKNIIGFSATPLRADGVSLKHIFATDIICGVQFGADTPRLMSMGYISPYELHEIDAKLAFGIDLDELDDDPEAQEYSAEQVKAFSKNIDFTKVVDDWKTLAEGSRTIVFCPAIADSKKLVEEFNNRGYPAAHIDGGGKKKKEVSGLEEEGGSLTKKQRQKVVDDFKDGRILIMSNCQLVSEGFDVPAADCLILLNPTKSIIAHLQRVGRVLRPAPGKVAIIIDYVASFRNLGRPEDPINNRFWREAWEFGINDTYCEKCEKSFLPKKSELRTVVRKGKVPDDFGNLVEANFYEFVCPHCGHVNEKVVKLKPEPEGGKSEGEAKSEDLGDKKHFKLLKSNQTLRPEYLKDVYAIGDAVAEAEDDSKLSEFFNLVDQYRSLNSFSIDECNLMLETAGVDDSEDAWGFLLAKRISACPDYEAIMDFFGGSYNPKLRKAIWSHMNTEARTQVFELRDKYVLGVVDRISRVNSYEDFSLIIEEARELVPSERWQNTRTAIWRNLAQGLSTETLESKSKNSLNNLWKWVKEVVYNGDSVKVEKLKQQIWDSFSDEDKLRLHNLS